MFISKADGNIGLVAVDNFTKMASTALIKNKQPDEIVSGLKRSVDKLGKPMQFYSDEEGAFSSTKYIKFLNGNNLKHIQTTTHAHTVERFIHTFRMNVQRRIDALSQDKSDWVQHVDNIITKYNNTVHNTTKIKLVDAAKKKTIYLWPGIYGIQQSVQGNTLRLNHWIMLGLRQTKRKHRKASTQHSQKKNTK